MSERQNKIKKENIMIGWDESLDLTKMTMRANHRVKQNINV